MARREVCFGALERRIFAVPVEPRRYAAFQNQGRAGCGRREAA